MNGSGMPVTGSRAVTTIMLMQAWATSQVVMPGGQQAGEGIGRVDRDAVALVGDHDEEGEHGQRADQAPLLADDGEDEVGRRGGQVEVLLPAGAEAGAGDPAQGQRHQRLHGVVAGVQRVAERVEEAVDPLQLVRRPA